MLFGWKRMKSRLNYCFHKGRLRSKRSLPYAVTRKQGVVVWDGGLSLVFIKMRMKKIHTSTYIISTFLLIEIAYSIYSIIQQEYIDAFGDFIVIILVYFIFFCLVLYFLVDSITNFLKTKKLVAFLPFIISLLLPTIKLTTENYIRDSCKSLLTIRHLVILIYLVNLTK